MHGLIKGLITVGTIAALTPLNSAASICNIPQTTLQQDYAHADFIFVGKTVGCVSGNAANEGYCDGNHYRVMVADALKGSTLANDTIIDIQAAQPMSCYPTLVDDDLFLMFLDSDKNLMAPTTSLSGGRHTTRKTRRRLSIITAYRDGASSDLAQPWYFQDFMFSCTLTQDLVSAYIKFSYYYGPTDVQFSMGSGKTTWDENGIAAHEVTWTPTAPDSKPDPFAIAPDLSKRRVSARIEFREFNNTVDHSARISIGQRRWSLKTWRETIVQENTDPFSYVLELVRGDAAMEILRSLDDPSGISLFVDVMMDDRELAISSRRTERIDTLGTQLGGERQSFLACVDGTIRRPPKLVKAE